MRRRAVRARSFQHGPVALGDWFGGPWHAALAANQETETTGLYLRVRHLNGAGVLLPVERMSAEKL